MQDLESSWRSENPRPGVAAQDAYDMGHLPTVQSPHVATVLDKELKRQVTVDGVDYTVAVDPDGLRVTGKGKRRPQVELRWRDLLSGDAALAVALNASLSQNKQAATTRPAAEQAPARARQHAPKNSQR